MDKVDWEGLKALEAKADKGPWEFEDADHNQAIATRTKYVAALAGVTAETDNFQFIVALLNAFPAILAEHEKDQRVIAAALDPNTLRYGAWIGSVEHEQDGAIWHGKILHIKDLVMYEADCEMNLHGAFEDAVHEYIQTCLELGGQKEMITSLQALAEYDKAKL